MVPARMLRNKAGARTVGGRVRAACLLGAGAGRRAGWSGEVLWGGDELAIGPDRPGLGERRRDRRGTDLLEGDLRAGELAQRAAQLVVQHDAAGVVLRLDMGWCAEVL